MHPGQPDLYHVPLPACTLSQIHQIELKQDTIHIPGHWLRSSSTGREENASERTDLERVRQTTAHIEV